MGEQVEDMPAARPWWKRKRVWIPAAVLAVVVLGPLAAGEDAGSPVPEETAQEAASEPEPDVAEEPQEEEAEPSPGDEEERVDWVAQLTEDGAAFLEYVDRIEPGGGDTVNIYMNRGDHREDEIVIGQDGETDRGVGMSLCFAMQTSGHAGPVVVHDPLGAVIVDTSAMGESRLLDGAPECRRR